MHYAGLIGEAIHDAHAFGWKVGAVSAPMPPARPPRPPRPRAQRDTSMAQALWIVVDALYWEPTISIAGLLKGKILYNAAC